MGNFDFSNCLRKVALRMCTRQYYSIHSYQLITRFPTCPSTPRSPS